MCGQFTSNEVILLDVFTVSDGLRKKRQLSIEVVTAVVIPQVLPIVGEIPLVPPEILIQAIVENAAEFENVTGTQLNGVPTQFFIPPPTVPPINFDDIAVIVLPIVVTVLVLALLGGIGAVLLIV